MTKKVFLILMLTHLTLAYMKTLLVLGLYYSLKLLQSVWMKRS